MSVQDRTAHSWHRFDIRRIENLANVVLGAELDAVQMAGSRLGGSLAFAAHDGIIFSSGLITGKVAIRGTPSRDAMTVHLCIKMAPGSRLWLNEAIDGNVSILLPGDELDAIYGSGSLYAAATLAPQRLEEEARRQGVFFDSRMLVRTDPDAASIAPDKLLWMRTRLLDIHDRRTASSDDEMELGVVLLRSVLTHYARQPHHNRRVHPQGPAGRVYRAREYIRDHLAMAIGIEDLARVAGTSPRSLYRAFAEVLGETPQNFVRRLRLHRIRRALISGEGADSTISDLAHAWRAGNDLGRLSARYQTLFGESPSRTRASRRALPRSAVLL